MVVGLSVLIFTGTIVVLVALLMVAEKFLSKSGMCNVRLNKDDDKVIPVKPGTTILNALTEKQIYLPSACGGGGTCGMCKCVVTDGGGDVLPTELGHLSRTEIKKNVRVGCQVKVKEDMDLEIPDEIFNIKKFNVTVVSNQNVATFIKELVLQLDEGDELHFESGGYIQIDIPTYDIPFTDFDIEEEYREDWDTYKLWELKGKNTEPIYRAYSMASHPAEKNTVKLNVRIATPPPRTSFPPGISSTYIFNLKPGDRCTISGPYGEFFIKDTKREMCYIGGGAGMAPMRSHIFHLFHTEKTDRPVSFWYGARSLREMFYDDEFKAIAKDFPNFNYNVALSEPMPEDNWEGLTGFIHQALLDNYLNKHEDPGEIEYYLCGPPMMIDAVIAMLDSLGVEPEMIAYDKF